jgi:hypothetical protein
VGFDEPPDVLDGRDRRGTDRRPAHTDGAHDERIIAPADRLRLTSLFDRVRTLVAGEALLLAGAELAAADPELRSLRNVNTPEDYAAALVEAGIASTAQINRAGTS